MSSRIRRENDCNFERCTEKSSLIGLYDVDTVVRSCSVLNRNPYYSNLDSCASP